MDNIQKHVTSLAVSTRLKELGLKDESIFSWFNTESQGNVVKISRMQFDLDEYLSVKRLGCAYLSSELADILFFVINEIDVDFSEELDGGWYRASSPQIDALFDAKTQPDTLGLMLIYLIENGLVDDQWRERWILKAG